KLRLIVAIGATTTTTAARKSKGTSEDQSPKAPRFDCHGLIECSSLEEVPDDSFLVTCNTIPPNVESLAKRDVQLVCVQPDGGALQQLLHYAPENKHVMIGVINGSSVEIRTPVAFVAAGPGVIRNWQSSWKMPSTFQRVACLSTEDNEAKVKTSRKMYKLEGFFNLPAIEDDVAIVPQKPTRKRNSATAQLDDDEDAECT
uniref:Uncharacterized protein n=1 Tax=Caenorhabditis japonica TaxID=281687 RepID=A0A8R1END7_CAEJA